jgi:aminopeptidase N
MLDFQTLNEDRFKNMMREFYQTYVGKRASTEDFRAIAEKYCGFKMDWFFNQWVYGTSIPTYKFAYQVNETSDSKFKVTCKVQQLNVPDDFLMLVPINVDFGDKKFARLQVLIKGPLSQFDLPLLPMKPQKIFFNDLESILCEVEYVDWK